MSALLPLWCAGALIAYLLGHLVLGPSRAFGPLLAFGTLVAAGLLLITGQPIQGVLVAAPLSGITAALLLRWVDGQSWHGLKEVEELPVTAIAEKNTAVVEAKETQSSVTGDAKPADAKPADAKPADAKPSKPSEGKKSRKKKARRSKKAKQAKRRSADMERSKEPEKAQEQPSQTRKFANDAEPEESVEIGKPIRRTESLDIVADSIQDAAHKEAQAALEAEIRQALSQTVITPKTAAVPKGVFGLDDSTPFALTLPIATAEELSAMFVEPTLDINDSIAPQCCPRCDEVCPPDARYCAGCSAPVMPWRCPCGHRNATTADFCVRCQSPVELLASPVDVQILD